MSNHKHRADPDPYARFVQQARRARSVYIASLCQQTERRLQQTLRTACRILQATATAIQKRAIFFRWEG